MNTKSVTIGYKRQATKLHIEFPMGMINIITGLEDKEGRAITRIFIDPSQNVIFEGAGGRMITPTPTDEVIPHSPEAQTIANS